MRTQRRYAALAIALEVTDNRQDSRYEIRSGGELAGFVDYRRHPTVIELVHTEIDSRFEGHALASELTRQVLDTARDDGLQVLPICPFVRAYIDRHREYVDLVPIGRRTSFGLPSD